MAEAIVGDITPHDGITPEEKHRREREAIKRLSSQLGDTQLLDLWLEFEEATTDEAKLVRDLDLLEMSLQARWYQAVGALPDESYGTFEHSARSRMCTPRLIDVLARRPD